MYEILVKCLEGLISCGSQITFHIYISPKVEIDHVFYIFVVQLSLLPDQETQSATMVVKRQDRL